MRVILFEHVCAARRTSDGSLHAQAIFATLALASSLSGCTSLRGSQPPLTAADMDRFQAVCPSKEQLWAVHPGISDGAYRDGIIRICVQAINNKYTAFRDQLSLESGGSTLVTELLSQALSTTASVVTKAPLARKLAAGSAFSLGVGSTINKDLFYKQTMPAIIASMDARRAKILTSIVNAQNRDRTAKIYTLDRAGFDLDSLQQAGSIAGAIQELTTAAADNKTKADQDLDAAQLNLDLGTAQEIPPTIEARYRSAIASVDKLESDGRGDKLRDIAAALGLNPRPDQNTGALAALIRAEAAKATTEVKPQDQDRIMQRIEGALRKFGSS